MKEYIEKLDALECVKWSPIASTVAVEEEFIDAWVDGTSDAMRAIYKSITRLPAADVVERRCGEWELEAHKENSNYGWKVTAECPECRAEKHLVWKGLFPNFCDAVAKNVALDSAKSVKLSNFCPNCGADMRGEMNESHRMR